MTNASEEEKARFRAYYQAHKEEVRKRQKAYYEAHREEQSEDKKLWYIRNKEKHCENSREYHRLHREETNSKARQKSFEIRNTVLQHYGGKCACCGETEYKFLAIDHINGDGKKHRKEIGTGGTPLYRWLVKNDFPQGFQILCHNCNMAKGIYGICPHQEREENE